MTELLFQMKTPNEANALRDEMVKETKRRIIHESIPRVKICLEKLSGEELWYRPNKNTVSVGNLVLHVGGNARQWILSGLGGHPDNRNREWEFNEKGPISAQKLLQQLDQLADEIVQVLDELPADILLKKIKVQGFEETGLSILIHAIEHFSYHVGQITYFVKSGKDIDLQYYSGKNLDQTNKK